MNIRKRLTLQFIGLVIIILTIASVAIYISSDKYRKEDFYNRLYNKANNTAKLLLEVDEIDAELLAKIEKDNPASLPNERIIIFNYKNEILYTSDPEKIIHITSELLDRIRLQKSVRYTQDDYFVHGLLYTDRYDRFVVVAGAKDFFGTRKINNLQTILFITFIASIVWVSFAGWIFSGRALKPISKVIDQVEKISDTSLNLRVDEGNRYDEIARLAMTFNSMLDRIEAGFTAQKNFITNASHEIRTPLTAITGKIDVVLLQQRSPEKYEEALHSLLRDVKTLNLLANRLLLLAHASTDRSAKLFTTVRVDEILWQAYEEVISANKHYTAHINLDLDLDDDALTILGDEQLVRVVFSNLMDNGCKYSDDHEVKVSVKRAVNELRLDFTDNGIGIPSEDLKHIFEPFYRGKNAKSVNGHGIGLSLVNKIISLHQGRVEVASQEGRGTVFSVYFPLGNTAFKN